MKVLHVIPTLAKEKGGPTQITLEMIRALRETGVEAEIVTTNDNGTDLLDVPLGECIEYEQVPVWFLPRFCLPLKEFIFSPALTRWLWQNLSNYQLIHTHYLFSYAPTCAAAIARWQQTPYIVTPYGMLTHWALNHQRTKKRFYSVIERYNFNHAIAAHCATSEESADVQNFQVPTPTFVVPYGVNLPTIKPHAAEILREKYQLEPGIPIILFFSRLHTKKRPDLLIEAVSKLKSKFNFHVLIAGSGEADYEDYLDNLVDKLNLNTHITFTGFITGKDKDILLQGSDLFVLPSFSENFGIAVVEAMAAKLPVVITDEIQIAADIQTGKGGIVINSNLDSLTEALTTLLDFPNLRKQLGNNGFELVKRQYTWQAIAQQMNNFYEQSITSN